MDECKGTWNSHITWTTRCGKVIPKKDQKKESDGTIKIEAHGGATSIKGKHKKVKERDIKSGQCTPDGQGKTTISFTREDDEIGALEVFVYSGTVTGDNICGNVEVAEGGPNPGDTGTWESDRSGGGPSPDRGKKAAKGRGKP